MIANTGWGTSPRSWVERLYAIYRYKPILAAGGVPDNVHNVRWCLFVLNLKHILLAGNTFKKYDVTIRNFHIHLFKSSMWGTQSKISNLHSICDVFSFEHIQFKIQKVHQWRNNINVQECSFTCSSQNSDGYAEIRSEKIHSIEHSDRRGLNNIWKRVDLRFR